MKQGDNILKKYYASLQFSKDFKVLLPGIRVTNFPLKFNPL